MCKMPMIIVSCTVATQLCAQEPQFSVTVSSDTILLGNYFELKFTIEDAPKSDFEAPDLSDFRLVGGPNTSTSMRMINGEVSQSATFTYYLQPPDLGNYTIPPAYVSFGEVVLETPPIQIIVVPNPDGIIQNPHTPGKRFDQIFPAPQNESEPKRPRKKF